MVERPFPEAVRPSVVAVLVTHDPGTWFDGTLAALAAQDHPVLHVLVIDAGSTIDPTERVKAALPHASVVRIGASPGFGAAANDVLELAPDADWFLFCHDDAAPESAAVRELVATAERWDAGVVAPKLVRWDDPRRLLHVGEAVDKTGATMSMVDRDELDQGQHDGLREVFSVPGAFTLVRSDLFLRVGGFDEVVAFHDENLSLCWRTRIAGARVVVTTDVRVRHREGLRERLPHGLRCRLVARNRLRIMLTCYGRWHLLRVLPQAALASVIEVIWSVATGRFGQARAAAGAWWWNLRRLRSLRAARQQVRHFRQVDDKTVRRLQVPGLLRPRLVLHRLAASEDAADASEAAARSSSRAPAALTAGSRPATPVLALPAATRVAPDTAGVATTSLSKITTGKAQGAAVAPVAEGDGDGGDGDDAELGGATQPSQASPPLRTGWTSGVAVVLMLVAGALLLGSRHLITRGVPVIGDLAPIDAPGRLFADWSGGWRRAGLGSTTPAPSAFGLLSGLGALFGGHVALLRLLLTVGLIPVGVLGAFRVLRPSGSHRAAAGAAVAYAVLPFPYGALAGGRWAPLAAYAAAPWLVAGLARAAAATTEIDLRGGAPRRTRTRPVREALGLGIVTALLAMVLPAAPVVLLVAAAALGLGAVLAFERCGVLRMAQAAVGGALVAVALHLPWSWDLLRSWRSIGWGAPVDASAGAIDPLDVLRRGAGMSGAGALAWGLLPAAAAVLLVGRDWRLTWAIRGWVLALVAWAAAWASWHRTLDLPWPSPDVLLTLGGVGLAVAVGSGVAAVEVDVIGRGRRLGLRRLVTAAGAVGFAVAALPLVQSSFDGYWQMPRGDWSRVLGFVDDDAATEASRVLWIGDPDALPVPGWPLASAAAGAGTGDASAPGGAATGDMAYATSEGLPEVHDLWPGRLDAATARIGEAIDLAVDRQTTRLGRLLAPMAVQYVVVPERLAPSPFTGQERPAAPELLAALGGQLDLERVDVDSAVVIYRNTAYVPGRAVVDDPDLLEASGPEELRTLDLADAARPALRERGDGGVAVGRLDDDVTLYQSAATSSRWVLEVDGRRITPRPAFGWANAFRVDEGGRAELRYDTPIARRVVLVLQVALWVAVIWLLVHLRRKPPRPAPGTPAGAEPPVEESVALVIDDTGSDADTDADTGSEPLVAGPTVTVDAVVASAGSDEA